MDTSLSLLERLRSSPDPGSWRRLDDLYRPLILRWLLRDPSLRDEAEDLVQEVMSVLVRELPDFERQRIGSFRRWLRTITVHRIQAWWRSRRRRPLGEQQADVPLAQLADPGSELSRLWDEDHDRHVMQRLLELIEPEFAPATWQAFRRVALEDSRAAEVAAELGLSVNAVLLAKSRILKRLREEASGLLD